jgi:hypothetical protein
MRKVTTSWTNHATKQNLVTSCTIPFSQANKILYHHIQLTKQPAHTGSFHQVNHLIQNRFGSYNQTLPYTVELFLTSGNAGFLLAGGHEQAHVRYHGWDGGQETSLVIRECEMRTYNRFCIHEDLGGRAAVLSICMSRLTERCAFRL